MRVARSLWVVWIVGVVGAIGPGAVGQTAPAPPVEIAGTEALGAPVALGDVEGGCLLFATEVDGLYLPAPALATEVTIRVSGIVARAEVRQRFHNPTSAWVDGVYVFPLPDGAAVDGLRMVVGERVIEGEVRERAEAAAVYERARREGRKASLVEQERPNLFTTSVANLGPGEEVEVVLAYQEELRYDAGRFALRFPLVAPPRYLPPRMPDADRLAAPLADPGEAPVNPVALTVVLDAGFPVDRMGSASHPIDIARRRGERGLRVTLAPGAGGAPVPADRDFVLEWAPAVGRAPGAALFTEEVGGELYALLTVLPPSAPSDLPPPPREAIFVIDTSGSMHGDSLVQARAALRFALDRLRPEDHFNVVRFASEAEALFAQSLPAGDQALAAAREFVDGLRADGGTEMLPALRLALAARPVSNFDRGAVRQVVFATDGAVGNEAELLAYVRRHLGPSRLFTVGIGSAPNGHFMRRAAEEGRGTFTYVGRVADVDPLMSELFAKLESPVLTGVELAWADPDAEVWPAQVPDLYAGEPVVVVARLPGGAGGAAVEISGRLGDRPWRSSHRLDGGEPRPGIAKLWARRKIAGLEALSLDGAPPDEVRRGVVEVALRHHLVSRYTSLVAVDVTPARPAGAAVRTRRLPVNLPAGWSHEQVVGTLPQGGTAARALLVLGLGLLAAAGWLAARTPARPGRDRARPLQTYGGAPGGRAS
ncbi:MAG TPA: marine proteobacterial sortase target protein [Thermoanaerobaculia bacterium]|nr:marine proteobacterial sortase target protein [Thermoanaerobaculia bacterium]